MVSPNPDYIGHRLEGENLKFLSQVARLRILRFSLSSQLCSQRFFLAKLPSNLIECGPLSERKVTLGLREIKMSENTQRRKTDVEEKVPFQKTVEQSPQSIEELQDASRVVANYIDRNTLLTRIVEGAVWLLNAQSGGIYKYDAGTERLTLVADYGQPNIIKETLRIGEKMAASLVKSGKPYKITNNYNKRAATAPVSKGKGFSGAVIEITLSLRGKLLGVLYVNDHPDREFEHSDAEMLSKLANDAAIILNTELFEEKKTTSPQLIRRLKINERLARWEHLSRISNEIVSELSTMRLQKRLDLIAERAAEIMNAESCGICLVKQKGVLSWAASYGSKTGVFYPGREFKIISAPKSGLTGHIAKAGKLFNVWGKELTNHPAVKNDVKDRLAYKNCYSLLALPLKKGNDLIGLLRVENKLGDDKKPRRDLRFSQEDEWILHSFGQAVVVAVEEAKLVEDLERLIASSPNGIIAIDINGNVTTFNEKAEEILGYKKQEVLAKPVANLYYDPQDARKIGQLLRSAKEGKPIKYETSIKTKDGLQIPILLSAAPLYDSVKKFVGSVGHFQDQRSIQQKGRHLDLLLKSSKFVAQAKSLDEGLKDLAREVVSALTGTFCRILLLDESEEMLVPKAAYPILRLGKKLIWKPGLNKPTSIRDWPGLKKILDAGEPEVLSINKKKYEKNLIKLSKRLKLDKRIESLLIVPVKIENQLVGLLHVGELRREERAFFSEEKISLAKAIAEQTAALIYRARLFESKERHVQLLTALDEASEQIRAEKEPVKLLQEIVRLSAELVGCKAGGFYINHPNQKRLDLIVSHKIPDKLKDCSLTHNEGLAGLVVRTVKTQVAYKSPKRPFREPLLDTFGFKTVVGVPLKQTGQVEAVLFVADSRKRRRFDKTDLNVLEKFVKRASMALHTSQVLNNERRMADRLRILHDVSGYIQTEGELKDIPHAVLTGITAGYGMGFNRATFFFLDEKQECLIGREAIGQFTETAAQKAWDIDKEKGLASFTEYREQYKKGNIHKTPLGKRIGRLRIPVRANGSDAFSKAVFKRSHILIEPRQFKQLPKEFVKLLTPATPVLIIPLMVRGNLIGLLTVDNKFTQSPITRRDVESLLTYANTISTSISNISLFQETEASREKLRSLYKASSELISSKNPYQVLKDIVAQTRTAAEAAWVSLVLIDEYGQARNPITAGAPSLSDVIRPKGISMEVMATGQPVAIEDTKKERARFNPQMFKYRNVAAALCLPLLLDGAPIGVVWIHYAERHPFPKAEVEALQLYVNQAAIAYDSARRVEELKRMRKAAEALVRVTKPQDVINQIVRSAREVLQADSAVFWYYDNTRGKFIREYSKADGILKDRWEKLKRMAPRPSGTAYRLFTEGLIQVKDINKKEEFRDLGENARRMLSRIGARRFLGVALTTGKDKLGVLYVNYSRPRRFSQQEQESVRAFANHCALALKRAKLLGQVNKARDTAKLVAELTTLENDKLDNTLKSIVEGTRNTLDCDAVTLYVYSPDKRKLSGAPVMTGVKYTRRTHRFPEVATDSIIFRTLKRKRILVVRDASTHPLFKDSRFTRDEKIASCVAIPLKVGDEKVGVMFANYHSHHRFTHEERTNIELLAHQASVAIRNAQLYERQQRRAEALQALYEAGQAVAGSLDEKEILERVAKQVWLLASRIGDKICYVDVKLVEGTKIKLAVACPDKIVAKRPVLKAGIDLRKGIDNRIGIIGRAVKRKRSQIVGDVSKDPDYIKWLPQVRSEIVVPIILETEVVGVINVEHLEYDAFDKEDQRTLESLAAQAGSAIRNARQYTSMQQVIGKLGARTALAWVGLAGTTWVHSVRINATTIDDLVKLARADLKSEAIDKLDDRFDEIQKVVQEIRARKITAPLSSEEGVESVLIVDLIEQRIERLQGWEKYKSVEFVFDPKSEKNITIKANSSWLNIALNLVVDNAVEAMSDSSKKRLRIGIYVNASMVEINITDSGRGIPPDVLPLLLREAIPKSEGAKGSGIGLLQAQAIVQTYGGDIMVGRTGPQGTTMIILLPLEVKRLQRKTPQ